MITNEPRCEEHLELKTIWEHVRAAIMGKRGAINLIATDNFYGLVSPAYRLTDSNYDEVNQRKEKYFGRGRFFNATGATHDKYLGMIGSSPIEATVPATIEPMLNSVDRENATLSDFGLMVASELLITARYGVLSNPANKAGKSARDAAGEMPYLVGYKAEQIIYERSDHGKLQEVRLLEGYWDEASKYNWERKTQVRRLFLDEGGNYTCELWREGAIYGEPQQAEVNGSLLKYIPFQFYGSEQNTPSYDRPVMFDLAHQNLGHFQLDCDNRDNLHYHGQGMTNIFTDSADDITENNPTGIDVGAKGKNIWGQNDKVEILQIEATGAIAAEMLRDEQRMIMLGAQVVQEQLGTQTATAKSIESNASTSQLKRIALNTGAGLTQNLKWCADFQGASSEDVKVNVNTKFVTDDLSAQDVQAVFAAVQGGYWPDEMLTEAGRRAGYTDKSDDEIKELVENQAQGESESIAELRLMVEQLAAQLNGNSEDD